MASGRCSVCSVFWVFFRDIMWQGVCDLLIYFAAERFEGTGGRKDGVMTGL